MSYQVLSDVFGWLGFTAWSLSFYPQIIVNFQRKSVVGLNFDYLLLNITGFIFYSTYNVCLFYFSSFQDDYVEYHPPSSGQNSTAIPVASSDVAFSLHAAICTAIQCLQCFIYDRGEQKISIPTVVYTSLVWFGAILLLILSEVTDLSGIVLVYFLSYNKLFISISKYIPQAYQNYRCQSTTGWSIGNVLCDFTGGILSVMQMFVLVKVYDDWRQITGNIPKLGLGLLAIAFDVIFMVQHYLLYPDNAPIINLENGEHDGYNQCHENAVCATGEEEIPQQSKKP